jgi:hypothetical protein
MTQSLRRSQFITTYGPGAILEGPDGPVIIPVLEQSGLFINRQPSNFEITDLRLSQALLNGAGILRIPSNAELGEVDSRYVYDTKRFPSWSLCTKHGRLYHKIQNDNWACPSCGPLKDIPTAWTQANRQSIRFVRACSNGHLDDVDWTGLIHHAAPACRPSYLIWEGGGGALRNITIRCPLCHQPVNLGAAYSRELACSGRFPEREPVRGSQPVRPGCDCIARIVQRGASNLRLSEIQTSLTIPPRATALHRLLEMMVVRTILITNRPASKQALMSSLQALAINHLLNQTIYNAINSYSEPEILDAINDTVAGNLPATLRTMRLDEFDALQASALHGHPQQPAATPGGPPQFEIIRQQIRTILTSGGHQLRITPVNRLRVVMVQTGYRRVPGGNPADSNPVDCVYNDGQRSWYPGVELFGEGIFIDFNSGTPEHNHLQLSGNAANIWIQAWQNPDNFSQTFINPDDRDQLHPVFIWWHTLSHRLINALSVDSGYSSAAVRERVYIKINQQTGQASGGVLLYTAQPGGDGTLGGMIALVPQFERVLESALRNLDACSNDPLCGEENFGPGKYNGAACYACSLISETSCEHRNMRLDRNLLIENQL